MRLSLLEVDDQREALGRLANLTLKSVVNPNVMAAAKAIVSECPSRSTSPRSQHEDIDLCELEAIYQAVKYGTDKVPGMEKGVRYVSDPRWWDHFCAPHRLLQLCRDGSCAEDCDGAAALIAAMTGALGFKSGLRAWGPRRAKDYTHVYALVNFPKQEPWKGTIAMDTTVNEAVLGWEPPVPGRTLTVMLP